MAQAITNVDLAYAAGLIDADGCIMVGRMEPHQQRHRQRKSTAFLLHVKVGMSDVGAVAWMQDMFGGYLNSHQPSGNRRVVYNWGLSARKASEFCGVILPYLKVKRSQAELAVRMYSEGEWISGGNKGTPPDEVARRRSLADEIGLHNQRTKEAI